MSKLKLQNLESPEPILRYSTLLQLLSGRDFILLQQQELLSVISLLEDSQKKIRFAALNVLAKYSGHLGLLEQTVVFTIIKNTMVAFNGIRHKEDFGKFTPNVVLETRIQVLYALKGFTKIVDGNLKVCDYLNFLLKTILDSDCSEFLKVAAVKVINEFPKTQRNIKRVFSLFRSSIQSLEGSEILDKEKERFSSNWDYFGFVKAHDEVEANNIQVSRNLSFKSDSIHVSRILALIGTVDGHDSKRKEIRLFGTLLNIESQNMHSIDDIQKQDLKSQDLTHQVVEKGVIKFGTEKEMVFSRHPFQETVYIRNHSDNAVRFSLQVFPSEFYTLKPAMGILKGGESLGVKVVFSPNPFSTHILQMIHGFIRIRSMGCALDR
jgi:hypothetical protein